MLAFRLARPELSANLAGLALFVVSIAVGTALLTAVWVTGSVLLGAFERNGRAILGGDVEISVRGEPLVAETVAALEDLATVSRVVDLRSTVRAGDRSAPVELRAVDGAYPLYGEVGIEGPPLDDALGERDGAFGAVVAPALLARLGLEPGATARLGATEIAMAGLLRAEPDRLGSGAFMVGPRVLISGDALAAAELLAPGALAEFRYRLRRGEGVAPEAFRERLAALEPPRGWELRAPDDAAERIRRVVTRTTTFLGITGVVALAIALSAAWIAAGVWVRKRARTIALYRLSGAEPGIVAAQHAVILAIAAGAAVAAGALAGTGLALALAAPVGAFLPVSTAPGIVLPPVATAVATVLVGIAGAAIPTLAAAADIPPGAAMRTGETAPRARPWAMVAGGALFAGAVVAAVLRLPSLDLAARAAVWLVGATVVLALASAATSRAVAALRPRNFVLSAAVRGLTERRATTAKALAIGIGIAGITAVASVRASLDDALQAELPQRLPALVMIDVQPDQRDRIAALTAEVGATDFRAVPNLRANIVEVNGRPAREAVVDPSERWVVEGDRSLSWTGEATDQPLEAGDWWPAGYDGPPLLSIEEDVAEAFAVGPGDRMAYTVLGRRIEAEIVNVRVEEHRSFGPDFLLIGSPAPLAQAPHTWVATVEGPDAAIDALVGRLGEATPNVTAIDVRMLVAQVRTAIEGAGLATLAVAAVLLGVGALVVAAVVAADTDARSRESLVFSLVGASRREIVAARLAETAAIGLVAAIVGGAAGLIGGWWLADEALHIDWQPGIMAPILPLVLGILAALVAGATAGRGAVPRGRGELARRLST